MTKKYRPYLTLPELTSLINGEPSGNLLAYLTEFRRKCEIGSISPQHTSTPRSRKFTDSLGLGTGGAEEERDYAGNDLASLRYGAYQQWLVNPSALSSQELARVKMYRYENDLMSAEEERDYERSINGSTGGY